MNIWDTNMMNPQNREEVKSIIRSFKSDRDLYYLAGLVMASKYSKYHDSISSLFMLVDGNSLKRLCKVLGGQEIKIPTYEELIESFKLVKFMNEYSSGSSIERSMEEAGFSSDELGKVVTSYNRLVEELGNIYDSK